MKNKNMLAKTYALVSKLFENRLDLHGEPYVKHCIEVSSAGQNEDEEIAGLLHDVPEDIPEYRDMKKLRKIGHSDRVIYLLTLLTHDRSKESYEDYIKRVSTDRSAVRLKKRDLEHNMRPSRNRGLTKKDFDRMEKYQRAYVYLSAT